MNIKYKNVKGFTLIEMMVTVAVLSIIILGLVAFFSGGMRSWVSGQNQLKAQREARQAMDQMVREIREGESIASGSDENSVTIKYPEKFNKSPVTFSLSGGNTLSKNGSSLIENIQRFEVEYSDTDMSKVSKIFILLEIDVDNDERTDITLQSEVNLRNFGLDSD
ncbi:MAG: PulJ/GspJ family protein [bacterium]